MAGGKLYISEMLEDLQEGISDMQYQMANLVEKFVDVSTNMVNQTKLLSGMAENITVLAPETIDGGDGVKPLPEYKNETQHNIQTTGEKTNCTFIANCHGKVKVHFKIVFSTTANSLNKGQTYAVKMGDTVLKTGSVTSGSSYTLEGDGDVVVEKDASYTLGIYCTTSSNPLINVSKLTAEAKIGYRFANILSDGPFVV